MFLQNPFLFKRAPKISPEQCGAPVRADSQETNIPSHRNKVNLLFRSPQT